VWMILSPRGKTAIQNEYNDGQSLDDTNTAVGYWINYYMQGPSDDSRRAVGTNPIKRKQEQQQQSYSSDSESESDGDENSDEASNSDESDSSSEDEKPVVYKKRRTAAAAAAAASSVATRSARKR